jgi:Abnormal spindle-like microcephaly-assoc'd, ASPM-SPD-2-Hydin
MALALALVFSCMISILGCTGITVAPAASTQKSQSAPAAAAISVSPQSISFGSVAVNGTLSQSVTISNTGGSNLTVTQASTSAGGFTITGMPFPLVIGPGSQSTLNILFSPKSAAAVTGDVSITSDAANSPASVAVSATGIPSTSLLSSGAASLSFGSVSIGAIGTLAVSLANAGNSNITISSVASSSASFAGSGVSAGMILAPGQSATLNVTFSPLAAGTLTGSITVASNASNSSATISVLGSGTQALSHTVVLTWIASASEVAGYNIYRSAVSGGPYTQLNSSDVTFASYTDPTVQAGQTYYYTATAVNSAAFESAASAQVSVTIPSP